MTDAYSTMPDDEATEGESSADNADNADNELSAKSAKQSQAEANYREGNPQRSCGLCGHFDSKGKSCDVVDGEISPFGFSDRYLRQDNPFREGEKEGFRGGVKVKPVGQLANPPANSPAPPGLLRIGRKVY